LANESAEISDFNIAVGFIVIDEGKGSLLGSKILEGD